MVETDINSAEASNLADAMTAFSVTPQNTDGVSGDKETEYMITKWSSWLGYYKEIPELRAAIDAKATWTVGKGWKATTPTESVLLDSFQGNGVDTFNTILENMVRTYQIAGDSFCEIDRDWETIQ